MRGLAARRAQAALATDIEAFERLGYRPLERRPHAAVLRARNGGPDLLLRLSPEGRIFGGNWGLEITTAEPVLPASKGLRARGQGVVKMRGVKFRGDAELAERLSADEKLAKALEQVHFERVTVDPEGRPVIRHMGGSVVWILFPPVVRTTPLPEGQPQAAVRALREFARVGRELGAGARG